MRDSQISREVIIRDNEHFGALVGARYIDKKHRVRLTTGEHAGEVRHKHQYEVVEFLDSNDDAKRIISMAWTHHD